MWNVLSKASQVVRLRLNRATAMSQSILIETFTWGLTTTPNASALIGRMRILGFALLHAEPGELLDAPMSIKPAVVSDCPIPEPPPLALNASNGW
jgi:hypothetical protein